MKKLLLFIFVFIFSILPYTKAGWFWGDPTNDIYNNDQDRVIETSDLDDPLRDGSRSAVQNVEGIVEINPENAQGETIRYISSWINYFLGLLGLFIVILIIRDGIIIITAGGDDNKQKEALKDVRNYIIALILIGVIYLIINLVFHFVNFNTIV